MADFDETGENKTEYEYIPRTNVVRSQKLPNGSKFAYGHDVDDTVTSITQSTEEGEENSTHTRYTCGEVTELVSGNNTVQYEYDGKRRLTAVHLNGREDYLTNAYTDDTTLSGVTGKVDKCVSTNAKNESVTSYTDKQGKLRSGGKEDKKSLERQTHGRDGNAFRASKTRARDKGETFGAAEIMRKAEKDGKKKRKTAI